MALNTDISESNNLWEEYGEKEYDSLEGSSAKKSLDTRLASEVYKTVQDQNPPSLIGEFGCGPAPISRKLLEFNDKWGRTLFRTVGFDNSLEMTKRTPNTENFELKPFDLADPNSADRYLEDGGNLLDVAILENAWYAVTTDAGKVKDESLYRRLVVLQNIWRMLDNNGVLILTDPNSTTKELNLQNTFIGLSKEIKAAVRRGEVKESIDNIKDPKTQELIRRNKEEILPNSQLFTHHEMIDFIEKTGLFEIEETKTKDYMGHNTTLKLRKIENPKVRVNGVFILKIIDSKARFLLEDFRRKNYSEKINPIVTGIDEQDYKHEKSYTAVSTLNGINVPGAIATFDIEDDYDKDSWEFAELFELDNNFIEAIIPENRKTAEVRRLGTITAYGEEYASLGFESMVSVINRMYQEAQDRNVGILFFTATPDRLKLFNLFLRKLGYPDFIEVPGVKLNRKDNSNLKTFLTGGKYFFSTTGWENISSNEILTELRQYLIDNKDKSLQDGVKDLWPKNSDEKLKQVATFLRDEDTFPSNASLYFSNVKKR